MRDRRRVWVGACLLLAAGPRPASSQGVEYVRAYYTKYEYPIPMRDGKKLFTAVYVPKDASAAKTYPILLNRTPYGVGPYGADKYKTTLGPSEAACRGRLHRRLPGRARPLDVGGRVRGRAALPPREAARRDIDETTDTYDTIEWLLKNVPKHHNGRVGIWGISYPGFYAAMGTIDAHPALEGRLAPGAHRRLVHGRRLPPQRRLLPAPRLQLLRRTSAARGPSP